MLSWFRVNLPSVRELESAVAAFQHLPPFVLYNDGGGLRLALSQQASAEVLRAWGFELTPCSLPKPRPAEAYVQDPTALSELSSLRFAGALVIPRPGGGLKDVSSYEKALLLGRALRTRAAEEWVESTRRLGYTYFEAYVVKLWAGKSEKLSLKLLKGEKPHRKRMKLSPLSLATLLDAMSWARFVNPVTSGEVSEGRACALELSAVELSPRQRVPCLLIGFRERDNNHLTVVGDPGTGKSTLLRSLVFQLAPFSWPRNVIVFDFSGEYIELERYGFRVLRAGVDFFASILSLGPQPAVEVLSDVIAAVWGEHSRPTPIQVSDVLLPALSRSTTLFDAYRFISEVERSAPREDLKTAAAAVLRRLSLILNPALDAPRGSAGFTLEGRVVVDLSTIEGEAAKTALVLAVLQSIYLSPRPALLVIDDATKLGERCEILERVIMHLRGYDVHVWASVQDVEKAPRALLQARHLLFFRSRSRTAQQLSGADPSALGKLHFIYEGRTYPLFIPKTLPPPVKRSRPIPFSAVAANRLDVVDLMHLYIRYFDKRHLIAKLVSKRKLPSEEWEELSAIMDKEGARAIKTLAEIYAML